LNYIEEDYAGGNDGGEELNEQDMEQYGNVYHDPTLDLIEMLPPGTEFVAELSNLPYRAKDQEIKDELKRFKIEFDKFTPDRDPQQKLNKVRIVLKSKDKAKALLELHRELFIGRELHVDFPELIGGAIYEGEGPHVGVQVPVVAPVSEKKPEETKPAAPQDKPKPAVEEIKDVKKEEKKKEKKEEKKSEPLKEIPPDTKSVWDLDINLAQDIIGTSKVAEPVKVAAFSTGMKNIEKKEPKKDESQKKESKKKSKKK
jgi:hypothetical protein